MARNPVTLPLILTSLIIAFVIVPNVAIAVGPIIYLPFKLQVSMTCGYHLNCGAPPQQNWNGKGVDWGMAKGKVAYASGRGSVDSNGWAGPPLPTAR